MKDERQIPKSEIEGKQGKQALVFVENGGRLSAGMIFDIGYADNLVPALALPEDLFLTEPAQFSHQSLVFRPA